jgi:hypothetical protein
MKEKMPEVWCADILYAIDPCAEAGRATAAGPGYAHRNSSWDEKSRTLSLAGAANEVVMTQLVVESDKPLKSIALEGGEPLSLDVMASVPVLSGDKYCDDPLVPVDGEGQDVSFQQIVEQAPEVPDRKRQTFLLEFYIPKGTQSGVVEAPLTVNGAGLQAKLHIRVTVHDFQLPDKPPITADINNYSSVPAPGVDRSAASGWENYHRIERAYFRMAREHRASFHLLPYSHSGAVVHNCAPVLTGRGRNRRVRDWTPFDRHWQPYLDGSNYENGRFGGHPVEYLYTPVNLSWPAHFENFGKPGYEVEFRNVVGEMLAHFAEKEWSSTKFEVFFNHKARWKYYPWDMDEIRFERDNDITLHFARLANELSADVPGVNVINRIDSSWIFPESARSEMGDQIQLWVVNRGSHSHSPDEVGLLESKGQEVWFYGGPGKLSAPDRLDTLRWPWLAWGRETSGFCWWNGCGAKSLDKVGGGGDFCFFPGERFGIDGPLASIRLKVMHRGIQDTMYLSELQKRTGSRAAADEVVAETIGATDRDDWYQRSESSEVSGADIQSGSKTSKSWNTAPPEAWRNARLKTAERITAKN